MAAGFACGTAAPVAVRVAACGVAESIDGVRWTKPELGLVEFGGSSANNIYVIGQPQTYTPFVDPNEKNPARRYKSAVSTMRIETGFAHSSDGVRWTPFRDGAPITGRASDTISQVIWDPFARVYRLYTRTDFGSGGGSGEVRGTRDMVAPADADLADPGSWKKVREWCLGWERGDRQYHRRRQIYSLNGWIHAGVQFGLLWTLEWPGGDELMESFLATTRGDRPWNLEWVYADRPFLQRGKAGAFDCRWIQCAPRIETFEDSHWIYYVGLARSHNGEVSPELDGPAGGIGLAKLRLDGFVFLEAAGKTDVAGAAGSVTTKLFRLVGNSVLVNVAAPRGEIAVEILEESGKPIAGFGAADAMIGKGVDDLRWRPRWRDRDNLSSLAGRAVQLRFCLVNARLYSFQVR